MPTLTIASYGYFLYPVKNGACAKFAAPHVNGEPHSCQMLAVGSGIAEGVPPPGTSGVIRDCTVHTDEQEPAEVSGFDLIVDFSSLACRATLSRKWDTDNPAHTDVQVALAGGELKAWPDRYTNKLQWKWFHCGPTVAQRALTSSSPQKSPEIPMVLADSAPPTPTSRTQRTLLLSPPANGEPQHCETS